MKIAKKLDLLTFTYTSLRRDPPIKVTFFDQVIILYKDIQFIDPNMYGQ